MLVGGHGGVPLRHWDTWMQGYGRRCRLGILARIGRACSGRGFFEDWRFVVARTAESTLVDSIGG